MLIQKLNIPHKQNQEQKSQDHRNTCRKGFWQNLTLLHNKNLEKSHSKRPYLNVIKAMTNGQHQIKWGKIERLPSKIIDKISGLLFGFGGSKNPIHDIVLVRQALYCWVILMLQVTYFSCCCDKISNTQSECEIRRKVYLVYSL